MNQARPTKAAARRSASGLRGLPAPRCLHSHETLETRMRGRRLVEQFACTNASRCVLSRSGMSSQGAVKNCAATSSPNQWPNFTGESLAGKGGEGVFRQAAPMFAKCDAAFPVPPILPPIHTFSTVRRARSHETCAPVRVRARTRWAPLCNSRHSEGPMTLPTWEETDSSVKPRRCSRNAMHDFPFRPSSPLYVRSARGPDES